MQTLTIFSLLANLFNSAIIRISKGEQVCHISKWLTGEIGTFARQSRDNELIKLALEFQLFIAVIEKEYENILEKSLLSNFQNLSEKDIPETLLNIIHNNNLTLNDISLQLIIIPLRVNLAQLFDTTYGVLDTTKLSDEVLKKYITNDLTLHIFRHLLTNINKNVIKEFNSEIIEIFRSFEEQFRNSCDLIEINEFLWIQIIKLHLSAANWYELK